MTSGGGRSVLWEQEVPGSNPGIPMYLCWSGHILILHEGIGAARLGAMCGAVVTTRSHDAHDAQGECAGEGTPNCEPLVCSRGGDARI